MDTEQKTELVQNEYGPVQTRTAGARGEGESTGRWRVVRFDGSELMAGSLGEARRLAGALGVLVEA